MSRTGEAYPFRGYGMSEQLQKKANAFLSAANQVILGKELELRLVLCCLLSKGHLLLEDRPGMGKTTIVKLLGKLAGLPINRVQFTNDVLPADILGTTIYDPDRKEFVFHPGPIFSEIVLGDELNRATPKTQSACLQAMEELEVTIDGRTYPLPTPFFFIGTQNPNHHIGTFPLPESQLDRFLMRIRLGFPTRAAEKELILGPSREMLLEQLQPVLHHGELLAMQEAAQKCHLSDAVVEYLQDIVDQSRKQAEGVSPRATLGLAKAAKSWAYLSGRAYVLPEDVQAVAVPVMGHRLGVHEHEYREGDRTVEDIIRSIAVA